MILKGAWSIRSKMINKIIPKNEIKFEFDCVD